ncbi:MAG: TonB-dependent receptor, partial [Mucilaginibacter sp.]|nr:TonB-dependent receptor [Mucilaginibacter sp.]
QNITVRGMVIDSANNQSLSYVTAALQDVNTKLPVKSALTKEDGSFELVAPTGKNYQLVLAFVGYKDKVVTITQSGPIIDMSKVTLSPSSKQLGTVSITAVKPLMKQEVDRISYDVQADPESKALTALDMMRKVPLLSVDASDNIKLKGSGNYKILINGKESALVAKNPSDILRAMPATNIEKIEVITTPPAKYDAEGLTGIINIITKKNLDQGYNLGINGRMNSVWGPGINLNGTYKQGKFGLSAYAGLGKQNKQEAGFGSTQNFLKQQSLLSQTGTNAFYGHYDYANTELSYEIDSLNLLTGSLQAFTNKYGQNTDQLSDLTNSSGGTAQYYSLTNIGTGSYLGFDAAVNYQLGFKHQKDRLLTISYKYDYSPNKQLNDNLFSQRINYPLSVFPDYQQYNNAGNKAHTFQLDYVHPLKKITIEAGAKAILRNNFSEYHVDNRDSATNKYITNPAQTNDFNYHQNVISLYNSYQLKLEKWTAKGGLRIEHTNIDANFSSTASFVKQDYNNLIPSISIQRNLKSSSFNFGFTERIRRPGIYQLNPFVDRSNPNFINFGNPNLRPELSHRFELTYSNFAKNSINAGINYAFSNNSIQNVSGLEVNNVGGIKDTVTTTTYQNLGSNRSLGITFNTTQAITKKLTITMNAQLNHIWLKGEYNGQLYKNDGYTGNAYANVGYKFEKGYRFGIDAGYYSGNVVLQGQTSKFIYTSYVFSKEFLNKKATISLVANNPYSKYMTYRSTTNTVDFYQNTFNQNYYRSFAIRFNYKFGKLNSDIKKNQRGINNDDTKSGGKGSTGG